jgi:purine-binding chemotaxis protein CheW
MYVLFNLGEEQFGLPIARVRSIIPYEIPTPVPQAPDGVDGIINLRGLLIPVLDLAKRLLGTPLEPGPTARIIVAESEVGPIGLVVHAADEVARIDAEGVQPAPEAVLSAATIDAFEGVADHGGRLVILLDPERALPKPAFTARPDQGSDVDA